MNCAIKTVLVVAHGAGSGMPRFAVVTASTGNISRQKPLLLCTQQLRDDVGARQTWRDAASRQKPRGHGGVEMRARFSAKHVHRYRQRQPVRQSNPEQAGHATHRRRVAENGSDAGKHR